MQKLSRVRNLIVISIVSMLLVFWLSTNVWFDTYTQRGDAAQLQLSTLPEETLFKLAQNIALERSVVNTLLVETSVDPDKFDLLYDIAIESNRLRDLAIQQIEQTRDTESLLIHHRYSNDAVESLVVNLKDGFDRISQVTSVVTLQLGAHPSTREEGIRMQLFDAYGNLIQKVNSLRLRMHFLPARNYQSVIATHQLKNAVWNLSESVSLTGSLYDSYLIKQETGTLDHLNREGLLFRIYQQSQGVENSLFEIDEYLASNDADVQLKSRVEEIKSRYDNSYLPLHKDILKSVAAESDSPVPVAEWRQASDAFQGLIRKFSDDTIKETFTTARAIERSTMLDLGMDTLIVLLCIILAIFSAQLSRKAQHQATHDDLTKLPNRRFFSSFLRETLEKNEINAEKLHLLTVDLDGFKSINDTQGHAVGDELLMKVAKRLKACASDDQFVARMGGDEFSFVVNSNDNIEVFALAEKIKAEIIRPFTIAGAPLTIGASIGLSSFPEDASTAEELQIASDFAMFYAKKEGKNTIQFYNREIAQIFEVRCSTERDLARAIELNQLELHYQPQFNIAKNKVDAVEALVRWNHPVRGMVSPFDFIQVAEECGLMPSIGFWVLNEACRQASVWHSQTDMELRIAVNVSVYQLMMPSFVQDVFDAVENNNITPDHIELEITESVFMGDLVKITEVLFELKSAGYKIALDDFGTGYSSLSVLQDLPLNTLKIDRSFISKLDSNSDVSHNVTATIAKIADVMGLETVAEGVESEAQIASVASLGIDTIQGYYYSKPVSGGNLPSIVAELNSDAVVRKAA